MSKETLVNPLNCSMSLDRARAILGKHFWGIEEWRDQFEVQLSDTELAQAAQFPWSEEIVTGPCPFNPGKQIRETHFAFLGLEHVSGNVPLTIRKFKELFPVSGQPQFYSYQRSWYKDEWFASKPTCQLRWYLMLREIVPGSENKTWEEQQPMLPPEYEVPTAVEDVTKYLLCSKKTGASVNPERYGRTNTLNSARVRVNVGACNSAGLIVAERSDVVRCDILGVSVSRKLGT